MGRWEIHRQCRHLRHQVPADSSHLLQTVDKVLKAVEYKPMAQKVDKALKEAEYTPKAQAGNNHRLLMADKVLMDHPVERTSVEASQRILAADTEFDPMEASKLVLPNINKIEQFKIK